MSEGNATSNTSTYQQLSKRMLAMLEGQGALLRGLPGHDRKATSLPPGKSASVPARALSLLPTTGQARKSKIIFYFCSF
jgi:hypothetical protein